MKDYKIYNYSKFRFALLLFLLILSIIPVTIVLYKYNIWGHLLILFYILITLIPFFKFPKYIAKSVLKIVLEVDGIQIDWIKPYWGSKPKQSQRIDFDELKSYKFEGSYNFSTLKLRFISGKRLKFHRWYNDDNDDFDKFLRHFIKAIDSHNKRKSTVIPVIKENLIMENKNFLITIAIVIGIIIISAILLIIFKGVSNIRGIIYIFIVLAPLIWVIKQIIKGLQKNKDEEISSTYKQ